MKIQIMLALMENLEHFFKEIEGLDSQAFMKLVESYLSDEHVEVFVDHIAQFYGIDDDDDLGTLAQIMVTGYLAAVHNTQQPAIQ